MRIMVLTATRNNGCDPIVITAMTADTYQRFFDEHNSSGKPMLQTLREMAIAYWKKVQATHEADESLDRITDDEVTKLADRYGEFCWTATTLC